MINFSADANENVPVAPVSETKDAMSFDFSEPEPYHANEMAQQFEQPLIPTEEPHIEPEIPSAPLIPNEQTPEAEVAQLNESAPAPAPVPEPEPPVVETESVVKEAAIAAVAVAATTAVVAAKTATSSKPKPTDPKKPEIKGKSAPIKKATTTTTTTTASKLAAKPSTTTASKTAAAPRVASRTVAPKVASTTEKKTTATTTTARRPLSNGSKYPRTIDDFYPISGTYSSFNCFDLTFQLVLHQP